MSTDVLLSPNHAVNKTRNAILRMKKCSPELRTVLRQRFQQRIQNDRVKILNTIRRIKIQDTFRAAFGNILKEEWKSIDDESCKDLDDLPLESSTDDSNLDEELMLEELLEKELLLEHEDWLLQLYEELSKEDLEESREVVCPLCCSGYLKQVDGDGFKRTFCTKCPARFLVEKCLFDLETAIFENVAWHDRQCSSNCSFVSVSKNENDNNLCIVCHSCYYLNVIE